MTTACDRHEHVSPVIAESLDRAWSLPEPHANDSSAAGRNGGNSSGRGHLQVGTVLSVELAPYCLLLYRFPSFIFINHSTGASSSYVFSLLLFVAFMTWLSLYAFRLGLSLSPIPFYKIH